MTTVALVAGSHLQGDRLFDPAASRDNVLERFQKLREGLNALGMVCRTSDMLPPATIDVLIFQDMLNELAAVLRVVKANPQVRLIYVANEPSFVAPLHDACCLPRLPVDRVLTWNDTVAGKSEKVVKANIGQPLIDTRAIPKLPFGERKLVCAIFANKPAYGIDTLFAERVKAVEFFAGQPQGMDLYGIGWEASASGLLRSAYQGRCENKTAVMQHYRFSLAYENVKGLPGLVTEKIFDGFAAGTVPVYLGAPNIADYIPPSCFVDARDFSDYDQLYSYLADMTEDRHQRYLDAAQGFIDSAACLPFTSTRFVSTVIDQVTVLLSQPSVARSAIGIKWQLVKLVVGNLALLRDWRCFKRFMFTLGTVW